MSSPLLAARFNAFCFFMNCFSRKLRSALESSELLNTFGLFTVKVVEHVHPKGSIQPVEFGA